MTEMTKAEEQRRSKAAITIASASYTLEHYGYSPSLAKRLRRIADEIRNGKEKNNGPD